MTTKYLDKAGMEKAIASIAKRGAQLDKDIQHAALSAINHVEQHGDIVFVNKLYAAMPNGSRRSSLAMWLLTFGKVQANVDAGTKASMPFLFDKSKKTDMAGAEERMWYDMKKDPDPDEVFDIQKALMSLLAKAKKAGKVSDPKLLKSIELLTPAKA